jgi:membrane protease YdiL (CAAX protease family)
MNWVEIPAVKWALPIPLLIAVAPVVWLFFRGTWRELDAEGLAIRRALAARDQIDYRPMVALTLVCFILTFQEYYGRPDFYVRVLHDVLARWVKAHPGSIWNIQRYDEIYMRGWWAVTRIIGYVLPLAVWPIFFRHDKLADFGLRGRGFAQHAWIYALCVVVMMPVLVLVSMQPDFADYYPMYKLAGRSWLDFLIWELLYLGQFFGLELFFRGWWLRAMRSFGSGAIWSMVVPYCMIHYGKPYLETSSAVIAGVVLGSLAMRTRSIYAGFLVHATVAVTMDILALDHRHGLPTLLAPGGSTHLVFQHWRVVIWIGWALALAVLAAKIRRSWPELTAAVQAWRERRARRSR